MKSAYEFYLDGIELSLSTNKYIAGNKLSLADISFVCDFSQFLREGHYEESLANQGFEIISKNIKITYPKTINHLIDLSEQEEFSSVMGSYLDWFKNDNYSKPGGILKPPRISLIIFETSMQVKS